MTQKTWYVIDTRTDEIINAVETDSEPERVLHYMIDGEHMRLDANPPQAMLERYRYWNERP